MNPTKFPASRASEVWQRLVGLFGGESVSRKFGDEPPAEWVGVLAQLNDYQLERGMRRLLASGKAHVPSLPEFRRLCVEVSNDDLDIPSPAVPRLEGPSSWKGDDWDMTANRHLLAHILRAAQERRYYNPEQTAVLVAYKKAWAQDMREEVVNGEVPVTRQRETWAQCMQRAESEVRA